MNTKNECKNKYTVNTKLHTLFYRHAPTFASFDVFFSLERKRSFVNRVFVLIHLFWMLRRR